LTSVPARPEKDETGEKRRGKVQRLSGPVRRKGSTKEKPARWSSEGFSSPLFLDLKGPGAEKEKPKRCWGKRDDCL